MAAERMLKNPSKSATASQIGAEIISEYLDKIIKGNVKGEDGGFQNE